MGSPTKAHSGAHVAKMHPFGMHTGLERPNGAKSWDEFKISLYTTIVELDKIEIIPRKIDLAILRDSSSGMCTTTPGGVHEEENKRDTPSIHPKPPHYDPTKLTTSLSKNAWFVTVCIENSSLSG